MWTISCGKMICLLLILGWLVSSVSCTKEDPKGQDTEQGGGTPDGPDEDKTPPDQADGGLPAAYFTSPSKIKAKVPSTEIMDQLIACIDGTTKGAVIYVNIYEFDYLPVSLALKSAYERGVQLKVMIDSSKASSREGNKQTLQMFRALLQAPSELISINNHSWPNAINHHKDVLFSKVNLEGKQYEHVVFVTSHNFTAAQMKVTQDAVILSDKGLYEACIDNWNKMRALSHEGMKDFEFNTYAAPGGKRTAFFYPKRHNGAWDGSYLVMDLLDEQLRDLSHDTIMIMMSRWSDGQLAIVDKLEALQKKGAHIEIITRYEGGSGLGEELTRKLKDLDAADFEVLFLPKPYIVHSKYMLIKGVWNGQPHTIIMNGSLNWTNPSTQHNNNLVLFLVDSPLFSPYEHNFRQVRKTFQ